VSAKFVCDCCGKQALGVEYASKPGMWFKPLGWFIRSAKTGTQDACSLDCLQKLSRGADECPTDEAPRNR
jgi:hypothetical protein